MHRLLLVLSLIAAAWSLQNCGRIAVPHPVQVRAGLWEGGLSRLDAGLSRMEMAFRSGASEAEMRRAFAAARESYKSMEFLWEYGFPASARRLNGPAIDEVEKSYEHTVIPAEGFQVLEELLYGSPDRATAGTFARAVSLTAAMRSVVAEAGKAASFEPQGTSLMARPLAWTDSSLLDAVRLGIYRVGTLGLSGFDSPLARLSLSESRASLEGMADFLAEAFPSPLEDKQDRALRDLRAALLSAAKVCGSGRSGVEAFEAFDRLAFLTQNLDPAYGSLADFQAALGAPLPRDARAYDPASRRLFAAAWNPSFFGPAFPAASPSQAALGRRLFSDPILSAGAGHPDGRGRSCATCHHPEQGFGDGLRRSPSLDAAHPIARNAPTLLHAAFQQGSFWDLRAESLEDQAGMVIHNPFEMGGSLDAAAEALNRDPVYAAEFQSAFGAEEGSDRDIPVTPLRVRRALSAYIRSLSPFGSPWDRYMAGDKRALDAEARHGFNVFMGKGKCATCHFPPLFNGTVPPLFLETDLEVLGVPADPDPAKRALDPDSGRMAVDKLAMSRGAFRTPTVRNAAFTAPYMHNGVFATLDEVMEFYDAGGGAGLGLHVPNQTLPADSLRFTEAEEKAVMAFIRSLSDTSGTQAAAAPPTRYSTAGN